jgi:hypothetical protein
VSVEKYRAASAARSNDVDDGPEASIRASLCTALGATLGAALDAMQGSAAGGGGADGRVDAAESDTPALRMQQRSAVDMWKSVSTIMNGISLTDEAIRHVLLAKGVQCWRFTQSVGETVVVPAGCLAQARFFADCVVGKREFLAREHTSNFMHVAADLRFSTTAPKCVRHAEVLAWDLVRQFVPAASASSARRRGPVATPAGDVAPQSAGVEGTPVTATASSASVADLF